MKLNKILERDIGLTYYLERVNTLSPYGEARKRSMHRYKEEEISLLIHVWEQIDYFSTKIINERKNMEQIMHLLSQYRDISPSLKRVALGHVLDDVALFEIKKFAILSRKLIQRMDCYDLKEIEWRELTPIIKLLDPDNQRLETFYIYNSYSKNLETLRLNKEILEKEIVKTEDNEKKNSLFSQRRNLVSDIDEEEQNIRKTLSENIKKYIDDIEITMGNIAKLDHWLAKAQAHQAFNAVRPLLSEKNDWSFNEMRNPYFEDIIKNNGGKYQPVTISLKPGTTLLSGANMGGKTLSLKTFYLNTLLIHLGYYPLAKTAKGRLLDFIEFIGYESQDVKRGLSSFASEFHQIKEVMNKSKNKQGLIIMDEPACGTNPKEGTAIVRGIARYFERGENFLLLSSHYDDVIEEGMKHYQIKGISALSEDTLKTLSLEDGNYIKHIQSFMDYSIVPVEEWRKIPEEAVKIIELLGLQRTFINDIKNLLRGKNE